MQPSGQARLTTPSTEVTTPEGLTSRKFRSGPVRRADDHERTCSASDQGALRAGWLRSCSYANAVAAVREFSGRIEPAEMLGIERGTEPVEGAGRLRQRPAGAIFVARVAARLTEQQLRGGDFVRNLELGPSPQRAMQCRARVGRVALREL